jgi:hypothetical protein
MVLEVLSYVPHTSSLPLPELLHSTKITATMQLLSCHGLTASEKLPGWFVGITVSKDTTLMLFVYHGVLSGVLHREVSQITGLVPRPYSVLGASIEWWNVSVASLPRDPQGHYARLATLRVPLLLLVIVAACIPAPWAVLRAVRRVRRTRRRQRGYCVSCAYDLRGNVSGLCPECGTTVAEKDAVENNIRSI